MMYCVGVLCACVPRHVRVRVSVRACAGVRESGDNFHCVRWLPQGNTVTDAAICDRAVDVLRRFHAACASGSVARPYHDPSPTHSCPLQKLRGGAQK